jgi:hypothetical protein
MTRYNSHPVSSEIRQDVLEYVEYHLQSSLPLKDPYPPVVGGARHPEKERRSMLTKRETRKPLGKLSSPPQGRANMTQRRGDTGRQRSGPELSHEKHTTQKREEKMARQREEKAQRRKERMKRHREAIARRCEGKTTRQHEGSTRRDEGDMTQWRKDMARWRKDMVRWRKDRERWREEVNARRAEKDLERPCEEDTNMQPRRKGFVSRLFGEKIVMVCRKVL